MAESRSARRVSVLRAHLCNAQVTGGSRAEALARRMVVAWQNPRKNAIRPEEVAHLAPASAADVYEVHNELEKIGGENGEMQLGGWKIAGGTGLTEPDGSACPALYAPLWQRNIVDAKKNALSIDRLAVCGLEAEIGFVMKNDLMPLNDRSWSVEDLVDQIENVCLCLEVCGTRFGAELDSAPELLMKSDCICGGGVIVGQVLKASECDLFSLDKIAVEISVNGNQVHQGHSSEIPLQGPLGGLAWICSHLNERGKVVRRGQLIITGKCSWTDTVAPFDDVQASFGPLGSFRTYLVP